MSDTVNRLTVIRKRNLERALDYRPLLDVYLNSKKIEKVSDYRLVDENDKTFVELTIDVDVLEVKED